MQSNLVRWGAVLIWMALIFLGSSLPIKAIPGGLEIIPVLVHFAEYFVLASLLIFAITGSFKTRPHVFTLITSFVVSLFYGITDELHQLYVPGRVTDMLDLAVDGAGALLACFVIPFVMFLLSRKNDEIENQE